MRKKEQGFGVKPSELIPEVERLEPELGLTISGVINFAIQDEGEIRKLYKIPERIPYRVNTDEKFYSDENSTYIVYLQRLDGKEGAHYVHAIQNKRFQGEESIDGILGGQKEIDLIKSKYQFIVVYKLSKSKKD